MNISKRNPQYSLSKQLKSRLNKWLSFVGNLEDTRVLHILHYNSATHYLGNLRHICEIQFLYW